jgi:predicted AlkP superfamily pyrophosphatase or phosphodiesterase
MRLTLMLLLAIAAQARPLLVISVDGLDWRYLRDADQLGLKIPHIRKMMRDGEVTQGVVGVAPTVTWPSHTSLITGARPADHGILGNRRPNGGDYYWTTDLLQRKTLWHATRAAGLKSASITWPVTVNADIDYNLPEAFSGRNGGAMDHATIAAKAHPADLAEQIRRKYPSFGAEWVDDRARALATMYLVAEKKPDLLLLHFVDLDSEAHSQQPYSRAANAILEYTDELIGRILSVTPKEYVVCLTSDHGFEPVHRLVHPKVATADVFITPGLAIAKTAAAAAALKGREGVGRSVPMEEVRRYAPHYPEGVAAFEPAAETMFGSETAQWQTEKHHGEHGFWPTRADYRSVLIFTGPGVKPGRVPEVEMTAIAKRWASILGVGF